MQYVDKISDLPLKTRFYCTSYGLKRRVMYVLVIVRFKKDAATMRKKWIEYGRFGTDHGSNNAVLQRFIISFF